MVLLVVFDNFLEIKIGFSVCALSGVFKFILYIQCVVALTLVA